MKKYEEYRNALKSGRNVTLGSVYVEKNNAKFFVYENDEIVAVTNSADVAFDFILMGLIGGI